MMCARIPALVLLTRMMRATALAMILLAVTVAVQGEFDSACRATVPVDTAVAGSSVKHQLVLPS